jgi:hypothetical protein
VICSTCGADRVITLQHTVRIGRRVVQWRECVACYRKAENR